MPQADNLTLDKVSILLKAPFGFGKTLAACSAAIDGPLWLAYFDKKTPIELNWFKKHHPEILKNITYDVYGSHNAHEFLNKLMLQTKRCDYVTVVPDSLTMMTASAVNWSLGFRNPSGPKMDPMNPRAVLTIPGFDEYKTETSYITQALDILRSLPCNVIMTAHPLPKMEITGGAEDAAGNKMSIVKTNSLVSYGSKVAGIVPGQFTEIYHMTKEYEWLASQGKSVEKRFVNTSLVGDEMTKTALNLPAQLDITDRLFWEVWKEAVKTANPEGLM